MGIQEEWDRENEEKAIRAIISFIVIIGLIIYLIVKRYFFK